MHQSIYDIEKSVSRKIEEKEKKRRELTSRSDFIEIRKGGINRLSNRNELPKSAIQGSKEIDELIWHQLLITC